ncbi:uncharacterized protein LOC105701028 [Orussus abietinus]|uniref:uncharacterized protein LOC105701028 n=1 Tax=Orussus abietinus TaxID=222816 RepID=UPI000625B8A4|nr:uncharacterized protein LOC105701028 [Orussus abietinus]
MATSVDESDPDEHGRPASPKRPRRLLIEVEDSFRLEQQPPEKEAPVEAEVDPEFNENERLEREELKRWQALQDARAFVDNAVNRILERHIMSQPTAFRGSEMEDTAVTMAIRNHGLVQSTGLVSQTSRPICKNGSNGICNCGGPPVTLCFYPTNYGQSVSETGPSSNQQEDFLECAIIEAIRKKGLSALGDD